MPDHVESFQEWFDAGVDVGDLAGNLGPDPADYVREPDPRVNNPANPAIHHTADEDREDEPLG
jgi:hypothetical protein